jgi:hypothetical protein
MSHASDEEVMARNRRSAWHEVAAHLSAAHHELVLSQAMLEDAELDRADYADQLQPVADVLRRAANDASEEAEK